MHMHVPTRYQRQAVAGGQRRQIRELRVVVPGIKKLDSDPYTPGEVVGKPPRRGLIGVSTQPQH